LAVVVLTLGSQLAFADQGALEWSGPLKPTVRYHGLRFRRPRREHRWTTWSWVSRQTRQIRLG
jgi:hypothetical protein